MFMGVSLEPTGRSTRTFKAICEQDGSLVILKDTWRITGGGQLPEHEAYKKLYRGQVRHIAQVKEGADILSNETITHRAAEKWFPNKSFPKILTFSHYRLVLLDIGHDLQAFSSVKGLVSTIHDALIAHEDAYFNANILHQDISVKNIVAVGDGRGLLIDWDMCKDLGNMSQTQEHHDAAQRRGTWKYMAARLLIKKYDQSAHNREDDLESFYHVLNWMALHYTSHTMNSEDLTHNVQRIFEESYKAHDGTPMGGWSKLDSLLAGTINWDANFQNPPLSNLLEIIRKLVAVRYQGQKGGQLDGLLHMPYYFSSLFAKALAEDEQWDVNGERIEHFPPPIDPYLDSDSDSGSGSGSGSGSNFE
ncbi:hypothetical protein F5887DRAFT_1084756 [Amanita rubescens]|nr:hypothetical protein F5887DRAFT_1084756 [Amanita rubescens]